EALMIGDIGTITIVALIMGISGPASHWPLHGRAPSFTLSLPAPLSKRKGGGRAGEWLLRRR
ncbi:MAG: hypothetical protein AB8F34_11535, partial [Akkermansiaceae bacterium]